MAFTREGNQQAGHHPFNLEQRSRHVDRRVSGQAASEVATQTKQIVVASFLSLSYFLTFNPIVGGGFNLTPGLVSAKDWQSTRLRTTTQGDNNQ